MPRYKALAVVTSYWEPGEDFLAAIVEAVTQRVRDGDFVVVSEKALSTATGGIVDESRVQPSPSARWLAEWWMRVVWGYVLSAALRFGPRLTRNLREYPLESGSRHKQLALERTRLLQALMFGSEGGIDGSNLPFAYVSLPLPNAQEIAERIREEIRVKLDKHVTVVIVDTDKTYTFRNFHFAPRPKPMQGIRGDGGVVAYVLGRLFRLRKRPTPLTVAGAELAAEEALVIANVADKTRGTGSGTTVWKMAKHFHVTLTGVTWDMLSSVKHKPIVIVRRKQPKGKP
jgi:F420-0:gamma-glutamyl ligase-like protein